MRAAAALLAGILLTGSNAGVQGERSPDAERLRFAVEVDVARAREIGWTGADDEAVVALAAQLVQKRFVAMERAAINIELEPGTRRFHVSLPIIDARDRELFEGMLRSIGVCELLVAAEDELAAERTKLAAWREEHSETSLEAFNQLDPEDGGPAVDVAWLPTAWPDADGSLVRGDPILVRLPSRAADWFGAASFVRVYPTEDSFGYVAVGFVLDPSRAPDFARVAQTQAWMSHCVVLGNEIRSLRRIGPLFVGGGKLEGRFTEEAAARLETLLTRLEGPLRIVDGR